MASLVLAGTVAGSLSAAQPTAAAPSKAASVCVLAYTDRNHDGTQSPGEPTRSGWKYTIADVATRKTVARLTSSASGKTCVDATGSGRYSVSSSTRPGWSPVNPGVGTQTVAVAAGAATDLDFGNSFDPALASVCAATYADTDGDGRQGAHESLISGRRFDLRDATTKKVVGTLRSSSAKSCIKVLPGRYLLAERSSAGSVPTLPTKAAQKVTAAVDQEADATFGEHPFTLDHFQCYSVQSAPFTRRSVTLTDHFGVRPAQVTARQQLCNPVRKNGGKLRVPSGHLVCYSVTAGAALGTTVATHDQFGWNNLEIGRPRRLCVPSGKSLAGKPDGPPVGLDHYLCYDVKPATTRHYRAVHLADQFRSTTAKVLVPTQLCTPVRKELDGQAVAVVNADDHLLCYTISAADYSRRATIKNQFETRAVKVVAPETLCLPALEQVEEPAPAQVAACDDTDTEAPDGSVAMDGPVDETNGPIDAIYPSNDTGVDTWYDNDVNCDWSIGGSVPPAALDNGINKEVDQLPGSPDTDKLVTDLGNVEGDILEQAQVRPQVPADLPPVVYCEGPLKTCHYTAPTNPPALNASKPFGGRDIIFVHGFQMAPIGERLGNPGTPASTTWPANQSEFLSPTGFWKSAANAYWASHITRNLGSVTAPTNRYLVASWASTQWLIYGAHALLTQTARAMSDGTGVISGTGDKSGFCANGCVIVSHSTGGPLVDVAMSIAKNTGLFGDLQFIPDHVRAHVAFNGAFEGSGYATPMVALGLVTTSAAALCQLGVIIANFLGASLGGCVGLSAITSSVLVDLVPPVMHTIWGPFIRSTPVPTLTIASEHPTSYGSTDSYSDPAIFAKWLLSRGFDDGVLPMNSTCANPAGPTLPTLLFPHNIGWPSGYIAKPTIIDAAINAQLGLVLPPAFPLTPVVIRAFDMYNAGRGVYFYLDQVGDRYLAYRLNQTSPVNTLPYYVAAGCSPYVSPDGMVQPVLRAATHLLWANTPETNPLERYRNHFSFLQSTGDHFGFSETGHCYEGNQTFLHQCTGSAKLDNAEEVRVVTNSAVYARLQGCAGNGLDCAPLLSHLVKTMVVEDLHGQPLCKRFRWCRRIWIWKRVYHRMAGWETKTEADYVYQNVLKY